MVNLPARPRDRATCMEAFQTLHKAGVEKRSRWPTVVPSLKKLKGDLGTRIPRSSLSFFNYALIFDHVIPIPHAARLELKLKLKINELPFHTRY